MATIFSLAELSFATLLPPLPPATAGTHHRRDGIGRRIVRASERRRRERGRQGRSERLPGSTAIVASPSLRRTLPRLHPVGGCPHVVAMPREVLMGWKYVRSCAWSLL